MATIGDISMISPPTSSISNDQDPFGQLPPLPPPLRSTQVLQPLSVFPGARPSNYPAICPPNILNYFPHTLYSIYLLLCTYMCANLYLFFFSLFACSSFPFVWAQFCVTILFLFWFFFLVCQSFCIAFLPIKKVCCRYCCTFL